MLALTRRFLLIHVHPANGILLHQNHLLSVREVDGSSGAPQDWLPRSVAPGIATRSALLTP